MNLVDLSTGFVFSAFIIFCRIGSAIMFLPGIGESSVSPRIRLIFAVLVSLLLLPILDEYLPSMPSDIISMTLLIGGEITIGVALGMTIKIILSSIHVLGMTIAFQSGLASGMIFDPAQGNQGTLFGNFLSLLIIVIILTGDLHYIMIKGITDSYQLMNIGDYSKNYDSITQLIIRTTSDSFNIGIQMAAPFIVTTLILFLVSGILSRLMPQLQIFFLMLPAQIIIGFIIFMASLGAIVSWFIDHYRETLITVLSPL